MRATRLALATALVTTAALFGAAGAGASTQVGEPCAATAAQPLSGTIVELATNSGAQLTMPSAGVITRWQVAGPESFTGRIPQWAKVLRPLGGLTFTVVDEDPILVRGTTALQTRIPVQAGDRIGLGGEPFFYCGEVPGGETRFADGNLATGATAEFAKAAKPDVGVPLTATLEPDADGDGWGDETQDQCPRSAEVIVPCPALGLDAFAVQTKGFAKVFAAPFGPGKASISFAGRVKVPAKDSPTGKPLKVTWKGTRPGIEGQFTTVRMKFSRRLTEALKAPGVALPLRITVAATNVAGLTTTKRLTLRIR